MTYCGWVFLVLLAAACRLSAQTSVNIGNSVPDTAMHEFLMRVNQGVSATAVDVTLSVTTTGTSGLLVVLVDLDEMAVLTPGAIQGDSVAGAGTAMVTLSLPARTGQHDIIVSVETETNGPASVYTGTVTVSAGAIIQDDFASFPYLFLGTRVHFGRIVEYARPLSGAGIVAMDFTVDFSPTFHTTAFAVTMDAIEASQARILDMTTVPIVEIILYPGLGSDVVESDSHVTPGHAGLATIRLEFTKTGSAGGATAVVILGPDVTFVAATDSLASTGKKNGGGGGTCHAGPGGPAGAAMAAVLALWTRRRRNRI